MSHYTPCLKNGKSEVVIKLNELKTGITEHPVSRNWFQKVETATDTDLIRPYTCCGVLKAVTGFE